MFKTKVALLGVLALLIASGVTASVASAAGPFWHVNGSKLGQGVVKQLKLQAKGSFVFHFELGGVKGVVVCNSNVSEGATIEGQGNTQGQAKARFAYTSCAVVEPTPCKVGEPINTSQLKAHLVYLPESKQTKFGELFEPTQGNKFVVLKFSGSECLLGEVFAEGTVAAEVFPAEKESQEGQWTFPEAAIKKVVLEQQTKEPKFIFDGGPAVWITSYGARLATGETWGVFGT